MWAALGPAAGLGGLGWLGGWAGLGWAEWAGGGGLHTFNEHSKLSKMQFEAKFTQFLFILFLGV